MGQYNGHITDPGWFGLTGNAVHLGPGYIHNVPAVDEIRHSIKWIVPATLSACPPSTPLCELPPIPLTPGIYPIEVIAPTPTALIPSGQFIVVGPGPEPPSVTFTASPTTIGAGQTTTLTWNSSGAGLCHEGLRPWGITGSRVTAPARTRTYTIECVGPGGTTSKSVTVTVLPVPLGDTYYVAPAGNDSHTCTQARQLSTPKRTIRAGLACLAPGDTLSVRGGEYRERATITTSFVTIQAYAGETPTIKGSDLVTGWTQPPGQPVWTRTGPIPQGTVVDPINQIVNLPICLETHPLCRYPYQVFINGQPQTLVGITAADIPGPGEFVYIPPNEQSPSGTNIWRLGTDPTGKTVEVSVRDAWLTGDGKAQGVTIRGLSFRHSSNGFGQAPLHDGYPVHSCGGEPPAPGQEPPPCPTQGDGWLMEGNEIGFASANGLNLNGDYAIARNNLIQDSGHYGHHNGGWYVLGEGNTILRSNLAGYSPANGAGGVSGHVVRGWTFRNNVVADSRHSGYGILCDIACEDVVFEGNRSYGHGGFGLMYEISSRGILRNNIAYDNGGAGILLSDSSKTTVEGNLLVRNHWGDLFLLQQNRPPFPNITGNTIRENILIGQSGYTNSLLAVDDQNAFGVITKNTTDFNQVYHLPTHPAWYTWGGAYSSPSAMCSARGQECHSTVLTQAQVTQILQANGIPPGPVANQPPVLAPIGNRSVNEGQLLTFTASATDPEGDPLTYAAQPLPPGASMGAATGVFTWTPTLSQAGSYPILITASDGNLSDSETLTLTVVDVPPLPPQNLLLNPSFELGKQHWWFPSNGSLSSTAHSGAKSAKLVKRGTISSTPRVAVQAGGTYTLGAWVKTSNLTSSSSSGGAQVRVQWYHASGSQIGSTSLVTGLKGTKPWTRYPKAVTAPAGAATARVQLRLANTTRGTAWFDDVELTGP